MKIDLAELTAITLRAFEQRTAPDETSSKSLEAISHLLPKDGIEAELAIPLLAVGLSPRDALKWIRAHGDVL